MISFRSNSQCGPGSLDRFAEMDGAHALVRNNAIVTQPLRELFFIADSCERRHKGRSWPFLLRPEPVPLGGNGTGTACLALHTAKRSSKMAVTGGPSMIELSTLGSLQLRDDRG